MAARRKRDDSSRTREDILDGTEKIMRAEGYAGVTSRRVAEEAGLKSKLVHYHFGTMEELFVALFQRAEGQLFERHMKASAAKDPLRELWALSVDRTGMELIFEFMALANHRPVIRREIARANERMRQVQVALVTRALEERGIPPEICPANVLALLVSGAALALVTEESIGSLSAHADTLAFVEQLLRTTYRRQSKEKKSLACGRRK
jgi:AcrR family transcriptional regulator